MSGAASQQLRLVLASASPARLATLRAAGVEPRVVVSRVDEDAMLADATQRYGELEPADVALLLARAKCEDVAARLADPSERLDGARSDLVLGCDSVLEIDGVAYGKPGTAEAARRRWELMAGRSGLLHSGHWLVDLRATEAGGTGATLGATGSTVVHFARLCAQEIDGYVATGEPLNVAGAFTIDGLGGPYIERIEGDHHNVVGLSLPLVRGLLAELGASWHQLAAPVPPAGFPRLIRTVLDATDARGLAEFYRAFLGWGYRPGDQAPADVGDDSGWLVLTDPAGPAVLAVNQVTSLAGHPRPTHPSPAQVHHDYAVPTLDELRRQRQRAVALGATLLLDRSDDPDQPLCTLLDPAGHRFCILLDP